MHTPTHKTSWIVGAMLAAMSTVAAADQPGATSREERMDAALENYRAGHPTGKATATENSGATGTSANDCNQYSNGGTFARAEAAMKRGACKTGHAIERGVNKTGHAIGKAGRKTGDALRRTGDKMGGSPDKATSDPQPR
jgi:hypothetical protein